LECGDFAARAEPRQVGVATGSETIDWEAHQPIAQRRGWSGRYRSRLWSWAIRERL